MLWSELGRGFCVCFSWVLALATFAGVLSKGFFWFCRRSETVVGEGSRSSAELPTYTIASLHSTSPSYLLTVSALMTQWRPRCVKSNRKRKKKNDDTQSDAERRFPPSRSSYELQGDTRERESIGGAEDSVWEPNEPVANDRLKSCSKKRRQLSLLLNF